MKNNNVTKQHRQSEYGDFQTPLELAALEKVCKEMQLPDLEIVEGEAAFYGPKADFVVKDCLGRRWQLGTVQFDYNLPLPERFNLEYTGSDNKPHTPVMIHRAPLGSFERFCGILIEHFAAAFPLWLAPEQIRILTVSDKFGEYGNAVLEKMQSAGLRASLDNRSEKIGAKIREGRLDLVPYLAVVGGKEAENGSVALRSRKDGELGEVNVEEVVKRLAEEVRTRTLWSRRTMIARLLPEHFHRLQLHTETYCQSKHYYGRYNDLRRTHQAGRRKL